MKDKMDVNDCVFHAYHEGFWKGQQAMIRSIQDLGLINEKLADLLTDIVLGREDWKQHFPNEEAKECVEWITEEIMKL